MLLKDKTAVVTGSSRGIGKAIALRFAAEGAKVAVACVRNRDKAEAVAQEIRGSGGEAITVQADVSVRDDAERMVAEATQAFGRETRKHIEDMVRHRLKRKILEERDAAE